MINRKTILQFVSFASVGVIGTAVHYFVLIVCVVFFYFSPILASSLGCLSGMSVNYFLNYKITFKSQKNHREACSKFFAVAALGFIWNLLLMYVFCEVLFINYLFSQIISTILILFWNFLLNKIWTFKPV